MGNVRPGRSGEVKFCSMRVTKWEIEIDMNGHLIAAAARLIFELRSEDGRLKFISMADLLQHWLPRDSFLIFVECYSCLERTLVLGVIRMYE